MTSLPRLVIAAPASGHGKTTIATGIMAALRRRGVVVSGHKVGPDYIDPGYHALATGRPGRNLDPQMVGEERLVPLLLGGARGADLAVVEGVMGLYDGAIGRQGYASTAHVARVIDAPIVLVVDISHASRSIAAVVHGMATFDPDVRIAGVILNKAGSTRHATEVRDALEEKGFPVLGVLSRDDGIVAPGRHLGLVPVAEQAGAADVIDRLARQVAERIDLDRLLAVAADAPDLDGDPWDPAREITALGGALHGGVQPVIAVAGGRAFTFRYAETDELLRAAGCRLVELDPLSDVRLPKGTQGIYLGGGFPETHAAALGANRSLLADIGDAIAQGVPTVAECAGLLYLCRSLDGTPMVGAVPADARMSSRLTLSYRRAALPGPSLLGAAGSVAVGHEFHRTTLSQRAGVHAAWELDGEAEGFSLDPAGLGRPTVHASYLHTHWAGTPSAALEFAQAAARTEPYVGRAGNPPSAGRAGNPPSAGRAGNPPSAGRAGNPPHAGRVGERSDPVSRPLPTEPRRWHHGDEEATPGLTDFAVNVQHDPRPEWLEDSLRTALAATAYPSTARAVDAIAARHRRPTEQVLPTAGAAEAFTLVARARPWRLPVVIHPQFSEPDRALQAAGYDAHHVVLDVADDFALRADRVPSGADLVFVGNPTNPTGRLHPAASITALLRPGRVVVVDEAFMDAVPDEPETLAAQQLSSLVVIRSLTKTWAIPNLRAGYLVGDVDVLADCAVQQPHWSVSGPALAALAVCSSSEALIETRRRALAVTENRAALEQGLTERGLRTVPLSHGPFVLAQVGAGVREALRDRGIAVRRGDTFPGLDASWVRIAVRDNDIQRQLLRALDDVLAKTSVVA